MLNQVRAFPHRCSALICLISVLNTSAEIKLAPYSISTEFEQLSTSGGDTTDLITTRYIGTIPIKIKDKSIIAIRGSYEQLDFDWDGPFDRLREGRIGLFSLIEIKEDWKLLTLNNVQFRADEDATIGDSLSFAGIYGIWKEYSDTLTIGGGLGVVSQLDEPNSIFPILLVDWEFSRHWHLTTRPVPGTRFGPGLSAYYEPNSNWSVFLGARYISTDYQLGDGSVFKYNTARVSATHQYQFTNNVITSITCGVNLGGQIELQGEEVNLDPSIFLGLDLSYKF